MGKECKNYKECPQMFLLGPIFSPNATANHQSECSSGGGYVQYYEVTCKLCGLEFEWQS